MRKSDSDVGSLWTGFQGRALVVCLAVPLGGSESSKALYVSPGSLSNPIIETSC
jgi:hypothetical protein